jgi:hypothetical protein
MKRANDNGYDRARKLFIPGYPYSRYLTHYDEILDMNKHIIDNGIDDLHCLIGYHYDKGTDASYSNGVNYTKATEWYLAASNNGDSRADYRLGMMHERGKGFDKNLDKAI